MLGLGLGGGFRDESDTFPSFKELIIMYVSHYVLKYPEIRYFTDVCTFTLSASKEEEN